MKWLQNSKQIWGAKFQLHPLAMLALCEVRLINTSNTLPEYGESELITRPLSTTSNVSYLLGIPECSLFLWSTVARAPGRISCPLSQLTLIPPLLTWGNATTKTDSLFIPLTIYSVDAGLNSTSENPFSDNQLPNDGQNLLWITSLYNYYPIQYKYKLIHGLS